MMCQTFAKFFESAKKDRLEKIQRFQDNPSISFFFEKGKDIYAAPEESRLAFARLKNPDPEDIQWAKDGNFIGINIEDVISGSSGEYLFGPADIEHIKVLDKEKAFAKLKKK